MRQSIVLLALLACGTEEASVTADGPFQPPPPAWTAAPTASGVVVNGFFDDDMLFADTERGEISYAVNGQVRGSLNVGNEPTRMVRVGSSVYFTLRAEGRIGYLDLRASPPVVRGTVEVGTEPFDIVALHNSDLLVVSLSQDHAVTSINPYNGQVEGTWEFEGEPRWMHAVEQDGADFVYVTFWDRPEIARIDPVTDVVDIIPLPSKERFTDPACMQRDMVMRVTGGMAWDPNPHIGGPPANPVVISEDGYLYIPSLYMDTDLVEDPANSACSQLATVVQFPAQPDVPYYAPPAPPIESKRPDRVNPVLLRYNLSTNNFDEVIHLGTLDGPAANAGTVVKGMPGDLSYVPQEVSLPGAPPSMGQGWVMVPIRNHEEVVVVDMQWELPMTNPESHFDERHTYAWPVGHGPRAVFVGQGNDPVLVALSEDDRELDRRRVSDGMGDFLASYLHVNSTATAALAPSVLTSDEFEGRKMFNSTVDTRMVLPNSGMSCSVCHTEGRSDGLTWLFEDFPRQPPMLAGNLHDTAPYTWTGTVATVADEIEATSETRMGGSGLNAVGKAKLESYLDAIRPPMRPANDFSAQLLLGEQLFNDATVGCATCHTGDAGADGLSHQVLGFPGPTNTPALRGIGASAPYLHDGSALTLRAVLERARDGSMGNTAGLSDDQMEAMVAYLRTL